MPARLPLAATLLLAPAFILLLSIALSPPPAVQAAETLVIGESVRGRPIEVGCVGPSPQEAERTALLVAGVHTGSEAVTSTLATEVAGLVWSGTLPVPDSVRLCVLPTLNPDGIAAGIHTNANEVDLNRNWPSDDWQTDAYHPETGPVSGGDRPLSEPESRALFDYVREVRPSVVLVLHCCGALVEANSEPLAVDLAHRYAETAGYDYLPKWDFYEITGEFITAMDRLNIPALDIEMAAPDRPDVVTHATALAAVLERLGDHSARADVDRDGGNTTIEGWVRPEVSHLYRVREGDTMWGLAHRFGVTTNALAAANNITHPWQFVPGRVLAVPAASMGR